MTVAVGGRDRLHRRWR